MQMKKRIIDMKTSIDKQIDKLADGVDGKGLNVVHLRSWCSWAESAA